jgi:hypothetical protein
MTRYELIKSAESILRICDEAGISPNEARYLEVFEQWQSLTKEGHKKVWVLAYLSQQYNISEATIKRIARKFKKKVTL